MAHGEPKLCESDEFTYDDLVEVVSNLDDLLGDMKGKYKSLRKKHVSLQESYEELKTSHENLLDTHEKLKEAHNFHISQEANKGKVDVAITCDLVDDMPKIDNVSKFSISNSCDDLHAMTFFSNIDSCMNDSSGDPLLIVENNELRNTVDCVLSRRLQIVIGVKTPITKCGSVKGSLSSMRVLGIFPRRTKVLLLTRRPLS
jgi:hypothetical protein